MTPAEQLASGTLTPALLLDVLIKLGIVLLLIYLSLRLLRRYGQQASSLTPGPLQHKLAAWLGQSLGPISTGELQILQVQPLNRSLSLYLIAIGPRRLLLSVGLGDARLLSEWQAAEPPGAEAPVSPGAALAPQPIGALAPENEAKP